MKKCASAAMACQERTLNGLHSFRPATAPHSPSAAAPPPPPPAGLPPALMDASTGPKQNTRSLRA